jgi:hypothetical protein
MQEWFNLGRDDVVRLRSIPPFAFWLVGGYLDTSAPKGGGSMFLRNVCIDL